MFCPAGVGGRVTDLGMEKGRTPVTPEGAAKVTEKARSLLNGDGTEGKQ